MHIERIYIQENFVPDYATDPFRRKTFGIGIFLKEGDELVDAIAEAEKQISDYVKANTVEPMMGTHTRTIETIQHDGLDDIIFNNVKDKLYSFEFMEDALEYLLTTDYKYTIEAKNIVNSKPNKTKQHGINQD